MAYRFNPPPNWPIDDANWSPPPGWQPDPSWGPAPEGWNFWVSAEQAPAAQPEQPETPTAPAASADDDATHVASTDEQAGEPAPAEEPIAPEEPAAAAAPEPAGQYGMMNPYGAAPEQDVAQPAAESPAPTGRHAAEPAAEAADDATHVTDSGERDDVAAAAEEPVAKEGGSAETAEYQGPDLDAGLAQQAPYETDDSQQSAGFGAAAGGAAAMGGAAAAQGHPEEPGQGYGQASPAPGYGQASPAPGYGQASPAPGYGQASPAPGYGQASPAPGYGQGSPSQGYGQASPAQGYGPTSGPEYPGQGSASDYPAQGYAQQSPGVDSGSAWTASTGAGEPPKKGIIQRFWWVGCLIVLLLVLALIAVGGFVLFNRSGGEEAKGDGQTTTQEETTEEETSAEEDPATEETTEEETPWPTDLPTIDPEAEKEAVNIVGTDGTGTMAVHMAYVPASDLERRSGSAMDEPERGDEYLVLTAKLTVTEGELGLNPAQFDVITPYGGEVGPASASYGLAGSGTDGPWEFTAGDEYTIKILFDVQRAGGLTLNFTTYTDDYTWDVPA
ncbi:MAG: hypothetical protein ACTHWF_01825 [Brachybacterium sp.]